MASALVIVTPPKPPGSMQLISPPAAVFEIAPANVLHGAVRLQGFASSPTPETHVLVAWAEAEAGIASARRTSAKASLARRREVSMRRHYARGGRMAMLNWGIGTPPLSGDLSWVGGTSRTSAPGRFRRSAAT